MNAASYQLLSYHGVQPVQLSWTGGRQAGSDANIPLLQHAEPTQLNVLLTASTGRYTCIPEADASGSRLRPANRSFLM
jgi:hypothetical protein